MLRNSLIYFVLVARSVLFFLVLSGTHAPGEHVLYETLHTKLGMENQDIEEVRLCWISSLDRTSQQLHSPDYLGEVLSLLARFLCTSRSVKISRWSSWVTGRRLLTMCVLSPRPYQRGLIGMELIR